MRVRPMVIHKLPSRQRGSLGHWPVGALLEFITLSWFRFEVFIVWLAVALVAISVPWRDLKAAVVMGVASPLVSIGLLLLLKVVGWVFYFTPGMSKIWGWSRLTFYRLCSRLIVQPAPELEMPLWNSR